MTSQILAVARKPLVAFIAVLALGAAIFLASSNSEAVEADPANASNDRSEADFYTTDEMVDEYRDALNTMDLEFPAGVEVPSLPQAREPNATYEPGFGAMEAAGVWRCAWEYALLDAARDGDEAAIELAATQLESYYDLAIAKKFVRDPERRWYATVVEPVLTSGNLANLEEELTYNCDPAFD